MEEASERASKAMSEHMQWYKEQMDEFKHPAETLESVRK